MFRKVFLAAALFQGLQIYAQTECFELLNEASGRISDDISFLASDELNGREPGTDGLEKAANYIVSQFREYEIKPFEGKGYTQSFELHKETEFPASGNSFVYKDKKFNIPSDYFPLKYSSSGNASGQIVFVGYGISAPELDLNDYKDVEGLEGKVFVMDISSPDGIHPHSKYLKYHDLGQRIELAKEKGAVAVLFVNLEGNASDPRFGFTGSLDKGIPAVFIQNTDLAEELKEERRKVALQTTLKEITSETQNIIGFIDNDAEKTVIIGAHYDHLGMGGSSSLFRGEKPEIHNGADDNASGTAGLLEIARNIKASKENFSHYNYLFIAFSGEEMGLLGSAYYVKNPYVSNDQVAYMLNMDMIGRMENSELAINGTGTSPVWEEMFQTISCPELSIKTSESGVGPSDHTSFYYKDIPVLHFFTGTHRDYHKPSDDADKINTEGEMQVIQYMLELIKKLEKQGRIPFTETKEEDQEGNIPRFTVTLGVLPDYMFSGTGMKIDGITEGKPADKAGLKAGDVVVKMGDFKVEDMMSYMKALSAFKKGDTVSLQYKRGEKVLRTEVTF